MNSARKKNARRQRHPQKSLIWDATAAIIQKADRRHQRWPVTIPRFALAPAPSNAK